MTKYYYIGEDYEINSPWYGKIELKQNSIQNVSIKYSYFARCVRKEYLLDKHPIRKYVKRPDSDGPMDRERSEDLFIITQKEAEEFYDLNHVGSFTLEYDFNGAEKRVSLTNANGNEKQIYFNVEDENWIENNFITVASYRERQINEILK